MEDSLDARRAAWRGDLEGELPWMQELACHLVRDREAARELVQDAWLMALKRPPPAQDRPRAWIGAVMRNLVRQVGRRSSRRGRVVADGADLCDSRPPPAQELERAELEALLRDELERLGDPYRSTLREHFERGLSSAEIARRHGVPAGTVRWRLKTGLDRLRARLDERYGGRTRWTSAVLAHATYEGARHPSLRGPGARPAGRSAGREGLRPAIAGLGSLSIAGLAVLAGGTASRSRASEGPSEGALPARAASLGREGTARPRAADHPLPVPALEEWVLGFPLEAALSRPTPAARPTPALERLDVLVTDDEGAPLAGAELRVATPRGFEPRGTSDAQGWARLELDPTDVDALGIPAASEHVAVRAHARGHAASAVLFVPVTGPVSGPVPWIVSRENDEPLELALRGAERVLHGRATDEQGRPLEGIEVFALPDPHHTSLADPAGPFREPLALGTRTDSDGRYELSGLAQGELVLCIRRPGSEALLVPTDARESKVDLRISGGGTLRGRILDERGEPARGARVWVEPLHRGTEWCAGMPGYEPELRGFCVETTADAEGLYELQGVHPRDRRVYARSASDPACVASAIVPVSARVAENWSAFLAREPGLRLRLVDAEQRPLSSWIVQLVSVRSAGPRWVRLLTTDAEGYVSAFEAASEADLIVYDSSGLGQPWLTKRVRPAPDVQTVTVDEGHFGFLVGRLLDVDGRAPACDRLEAYEDTIRVPAPIRFDPETGRFRARLQPGHYTLLLRGEQGGARLTRAEVVGGERTRLGRLSPPGMGELSLRADRFGNGQGNYRLQVCFGQSAVKWREGALPLVAEERTYAGLYRVDSTGADGVLQSGWVRVVEDGVAELDLEGLPRVLIEVHVDVQEPREPLGGVALTVSAADVEARTDPELAEPERRVLFSRRSDGRLLHALRLPPGRWKVSARVESAASAETWIEVVAGGSYRLALDLDAP